MRTKGALVLATMALLIACGCSAPYYVILINGCPADISVFYHDRLHVVPSGEILNIKLDDRAKHTEVMIDGVSATYRWRYPPKAFHEESGLSRKFVVQVNGDKRIYLLAPFTRTIQNDLPEQPEGYPLESR